MLKDIFEKIDYFWFCLFITFFVCFGYFFTNPTIGIDDEIISFFTSTEIILQVGRLGKFLTNFLFNPEFVPVIYEFIGVVCFVISVILMCDIFKKYLPNFSKKEMTIFSTMAISFPFAAFVFIFLQNTIDIGLCYLFATVAANYSMKFFYEDKNKKYLLFSFILLLFSLSMYETGIFYFLLIHLFVILYSTIFENNPKSSNSQLYKQIATCLFTVFSSVVVYRIILKLVMLVVGYNYNKITNYLKYDFSSFESFCTSVVFSYNEFGRILCSNVSSHFCCKVIVFSCISLFLVSLFYAIKKKNILLVFVSIFMVSLPVSYFFATAFPWMQYRIFFAYGILNAMTFVILYKLFAKNIYVERTLLFLCFLVVFHQAKEMNAMFFTEHLKYENEKLFAYSIDRDLKRLNLEHYPVVFVGVRKPINPQFLYYGLANELNGSIYNWDRVDSVEKELYIERPYKFMQQIGYDIYSYFTKENLNEFVTQKEKFKKIVSDMPIYPKEGAIKQVDNYVVIKIGKSRLDETFIQSRNNHY